MSDEIHRTGAREAREIRDPRALRAIGHPLRLRLLEELFVDGPATATELAERVGESPANCSWHLRQLAKYGFVEEAGGGTGRQRPWQIVVRANTWGRDDGDSELNVAGDAAAEVLFRQEFEAFLGWTRRRRGEPVAWRDAAFSMQSVAWLTAAELRDLDTEISALLMRHFDRVADPSLRPPGSRPVRFVAWGIPARPHRDDPEA